MKDSGVEWIGEIPEEWEVAKIKYYCDSIYSGGTPSRLEPKYWNGDINWIPSGYCKNKEIIKAEEKITKEALLSSSTKLINKDTPLVAMTGATCGFTGYLKIDACINQSIMAYIPDKLTSSRFLWYLTMSLYQKYLSLQSGGAQAGINSIDAKNIYVPYVKIKEQNNIAKILDKKTGQIEDIKSTIMKEIQILEDYKKSIITEAVTKGLDKNVEMKDSGIEWIGDIPKHWKVVALKYFSENYSGGTPSRNKIEYWEDGKIPWVSSGEINKDYIYDTYEHITELGLINSSAKIFPENTVLVALNGQGKTKGKTAVLKIRATTNQSLTGFICDEINLHYKFLYYQFKSSYKFNRSYYSGGDNRDGIAASNLKTARLSLPNISEQKEIVKYLDKKTKSIDESIEAKQKQLETLEEYKKSLIYEYVTGKKEVL